MRYDTPMSQPLAVNTPASKPATAVSGTTPTAGVKPSTIATSNVNSASAATLTTAPSASATATLPNPTATGVVDVKDLPLRQQLRAGLRDMYRSSISSGRNFAKVGAIFSGTECAIEGLRAKNDLYNGVAGGCLTGGILARNAGPQAVAVGCAGFAVFSAAIDAYMRMPEDERSKPIA
jgi:import inner membrane translocase subunit TIM22